jgi:hypothetical protein
MLGRGIRSLPKTFTVTFFFSVCSCVTSNESPEDLHLDKRSVESLPFLKRVFAKGRVRVTLCSLFAENVMVDCKLGLTAVGLHSQRSPCFHGLCKIENPAPEGCFIDTGRGANPSHTPQTTSTSMGLKVPRTR